jgi:homoserine/homoserine lactone efflux protein
MTIELYASFVVACLVVLAIPGPTVILVISYALSHGWRVALASVAGVGLGDATGVTLSLIGLGAVLSVSVTLFTVLKWVGALYLIWLGIKLWRARPAPIDALGADVPGTARVRRKSMFWRSWLVTTLNPKGIAFYVAFLPHFVAPAAPIAPQLVLLGTTFVILGIINAALYALFASSIRRSFKSSRAMAWMNRVSGSFLIGAGIMTAAIRRAS